MEQDCFSLSVITFELQFLTNGKFYRRPKFPKMKCPIIWMTARALTKTFT
ncbi:hypothetical protein L284_17795 [Novosphingobium lindaniclasticum LE124]|uniref:Uncharacterized protein n=1 Tax=Novosphingobium lindaniclasticum LE124 TaxID=1096930 RepID=T0HDU4_9SPHN|nr:hypothetical protein L284_17795 [Novosphingobium lindaniclasticum LE124]